MPDTTFDQFRPDPATDPVGYLRSLYAVRDQAAVAIKKAEANELKSFDVDLSKLDEVVDVVMSVIKVSSQFWYLATLI